MNMPVDPRKAVYSLVRVDTRSMTCGAIRPGPVHAKAFASGLAQGGRRAHRLIPYDEDFRLFTLPTTRKGTAKVVPCQGVQINYISYWSDVFLDAAVEKTQVPVRYDPLDAGTAYAFVKRRWVRCISQHYARFAGRSEREVMLATAELRRQHQGRGRRPITAGGLADFLVSVEGGGSAVGTTAARTRRDRDFASHLEWCIAASRGPQRSLSLVAVFVPRDEKEARESKSPVASWAPSR